MWNEITAVVERDRRWYIAYCPESPDTIFGVITHLNDNRRWTREQIPGWVAGIEPTDLFPRAPSGKAGGMVQPTAPSRNAVPEA